MSLIATLIRVTTRRLGAAFVVSGVLVIAWRVRPLSAGTHIVVGGTTRALSSRMRHSSLPSLLIRNSLVTGTQIIDAIDAIEATSTTWLEHLLATGALDENQVCELLARETRLQRCSPQQLGDASPAAIECIPADIAIEHRAMPVGIDADGYLVIAMVDPTDSAAIEEIGFFAGRPVLREVASATALACALHHYYGAPTVLWPRPSQRAASAPSYAMQAQG